MSLTTLRRDEGRSGGGATGCADSGGPGRRPRALAQVRTDWVILGPGSASESLMKSSFVMMVRGLLESPEAAEEGNWVPLETMFPVTLVGTSSPFPPPLWGWGETRGSVTQGPGVHHGACTAGNLRGNPDGPARWDSDAMNHAEAPGWW